MAAAAPPSEAAAAAAPPRPPLLAVTKHVAASPGPPTYLFMSTNNQSTFKSEALFHAADGTLAYRLRNIDSLFGGKKELLDGAGRLVLCAKKFPLSLAKWTISSPGGVTLAKSRTISGMAKYAITADLCNAKVKPTLTVSPDLSNSQVLMWQNNGKRAEDTMMAVAAYGANVALGLVSAAVQDWTYHLTIEPGADVALTCMLLIIFTDLLEWNALGGAFGMN